MPMRSPPHIDVPHSEMTPDKIRYWGQFLYDSPLYEELVSVVAESVDLLEIVGSIDNRPRPNIFFAAVQFLLFDEPEHPLTAFYESMNSEPAEPEEVGSAFTDFVLEHRLEIENLGRTRWTQTNECRRCALLLPAIWAGALGEFHLVDVGTSAGLNLAIDRYAYQWGETVWGDSPLLLSTEGRGVAPEPKGVEVLSRTGLDLNPIDTSDPIERRWLDALIWPGHRERRQRLRLAIDIANAVPKDLVAGDALITLEEVLSELPAGEPTVVMHSFVMNQLDDAQRRSFSNVIDEARSNRTIHRVGVEHLRVEQQWSDVLLDVGEGLESIGLAHHHAEWLELYARP